MTIIEPVYDPADGLNPYTVESDRVLAPDAVEKYQSLIEVARNDVQRFASTVAALGELAQFPWRYLAPEERFLSEMVATAFYEHAIAIAWRVWHDRDRRSVTVEGVTAFTLANIERHYRRTARRNVRLQEASQSEREVLNRIALLRNKRVGHSDSAFRIDAPAPSGWPSVPDLTEMASVFGRNLRMISFPFEATDFVVPDVFADLISTLDDLALRSDYSTLHESNLREWRELVLDLPPNRRGRLIAEIQIRRQRAGLPPFEDVSS